MPSLGSKLLGAFLLIVGATYLIVVTPHDIKSSADYGRRTTPVEALVIRSEWADTSNGGCRYWFRYEYEFEGRKDTGRRITRPDIQNSCEQIRRTLKTYPVGARIQAYHLRGDTAVQAFLVNRRELQHPLSLAIPLTMIATAFGAGLLLPGYLEPKASARRAGRWHVIRSRGSIGLHAQTWTLGISAFWIGWITSIALDAAHWGFDSAVFFDSLGLLTLAVGVTVTAFTYFRLHKFVDDPVVAVDRWPLQRGQPFVVRVSIPMRRRVALEYASVGIACRAGPSKHRPQPDESTVFHMPLGSQDAPTVADAMHRFEVKMTVPALSDVTISKRPLYAWFVVVHIDPDGAPGQDLDYPVEVV
ncbi:MAG: hypothetical protein C0503_03180 [Gemmatimonas sp.]|nr:hypothetical protein [Gemmatimonas sp.]